MLHKKIPIIQSMIKHMDTCVSVKTPLKTNTENNNNNNNNNNNSTTV